MRNCKGQALIEFIMILPVLILLIMGVFDFGNILYKKNIMQSMLDDIEEMYQNNNLISIDNYIKKEGLKIDYTKEDEFIKITISKDVEIITPGLSNILGSPYTIKEERLVYVYE